MGKIIVTGGAGYIGSHVVKELIKSGHKDIIVLDNLSSGTKSSVLSPAELIVLDLANVVELENVFLEHKPDAVLHFAAFIDAAESVTKPEKYYKNNLANGLNLLSAMKKSNTKKIIFSSTAAVYGETTKMPISEEASTGPISAYGQSKLMFEKVLADYGHAYGVHSVALRYFNAAGADIEGELGGDLQKKHDLVSTLIKVAKRQQERFIINGVDYDTKDGSCVRDLIHVNDLASAHVLALDYLGQGGKSDIFNLGSEEGFTVKQAAETAKKITGTDFIVENGPRREGDIVVSIASSEKAKRILRWKQQYSSLETIIKTAWEWENINVSTKK